MDRGCLKDTYVNFRAKKGASAFRDCSAAQEMCFYISELYSLLEKLEYTKSTEKKKEKKAEADYNEVRDETHSTKKIIHN